eukprot:10013249-Alexandrium_andersonii.AAC.1
MCIRDSVASSYSSRGSWRRVGGAESASSGINALAAAWPAGRGRLGSRRASAGVAGAPDAP